MSVTAKCRKSLDERRGVHFQTTHPDGDAYRGVVTHLRPGFVVLREEVDFEFDGFLVLPRRSIKSVRDGKYERCANDILRQRGALKRLRPARWLDPCATLPELIAALMRRRVWPAVETLPAPGGESSLYLGPLTGVGGDSFTLWCYDAAGRWEAEYEIGYAEVFRIEFDSRYCRHFNAYMRAKGGP